MSDDTGNTLGLQGAINRLGGLAQNMNSLQPQQNDREHATVTDLYRLYERLAVNSEHTQEDVKELRAEVKEGLKELAVRIEQQGGKQVNQQEFEQVKRDTRYHRVWLILLTVGFCLLASGLLYLFIFVFNSGL